MEKKPEKGEWMGQVFVFVMVLFIVGIVVGGVTMTVASLIMFVFLGVPFALGGMYVVCGILYHGFRAMAGLSDDQDS